MSFSTVDFPGSDTKVFGINDPGDIVGRYLDGGRHGFLDRGGDFRTIDDPDFTQCRARGINNAGQIVGQCEDADGHDHGFFLDTDGNFSTIDDPDFTQCRAHGINSAGQIVENCESHGVFRNTDGSFTVIDFPAAVATSAEGINDSGHIVGVYCLTLSCVDTLVGVRGFLAVPTP